MNVSEQCRIATASESIRIIMLYGIYFIQACRPYHKKGIDNLDRVQRRLTGLSTLETRTLKGENIETLNSYVDVNKKSLFKN